VIRTAQSQELSCGGQSRARSRQHGQAEATELGVAVYAVAVVVEFSHDRADKHGANGCQGRPTPYSLWE